MKNKCTLNATHKDIEEIGKILKTFDDNMIIYEILEGGERNSYISAQDYLYLKTALLGVLKKYSLAEGNYEPKVVQK